MAAKINGIPSSIIQRDLHRAKMQIIKIKEPIIMINSQIIGSAS